MFQQVTIVGNLGRDPEMRYTPQGNPVTTLNVATSRKYNTADGTQKEETLWFRVAVWGKQAETVNEHLTKGSRVLILGSLVGDDTGNPRIWSDKEGKPRASFELRADTVRFLSGTKKKDENQIAATEPQGEQNATESYPF